MHVEPALAAAAARVTATFLLFTVVGALAAHFPRRPDGDHGLLSHGTSRKLSVLSLALLQPCLTVYTLGSSLHPGDLRALWPLVLWGGVMVAVSAALGGAVIVLTRTAPAHRRMALVALAFSNVTGMPSTIMEALCGTQALAGEPRCLDRAVGFVYLASLLWSCAFWTLGVNVIAGAAPPPTASDAATAAVKPAAPPSFGLRAWRAVAAVMTPTLGGVFVGLLVAFVPALQAALFGPTAPLGFAGALVRMLGSPTVALNQLLFGASVGRSLLRVPWRATWQRFRGMCGRHACKRSVTAGMLPLEALEEPDAALLPVEDSKAPGGVMPAREIAVLVLTRAMLIPGLLFALVRGIFARHVASAGPDAALAALVMYVQRLAPTANAVTIVSLQHRLGPLADSVALSVALQILVLLPVLVLGVSLALAWTY